MRILAFDFGEKYIGIALANTATGSTQALASIKAKQGKPQWLNIIHYIDVWQPQRLIVGLPLHMDGSENELCRRARKFANRLHAQSRLHVDMVDERLSSKSVAEYIDQRTDIHALSAQAIAQTWLSSQIDAGS